MSTFIDRLAGAEHESGAQLLLVCAGCGGVHLVAVSRAGAYEFSCSGHTTSGVVDAQDPEVRDAVRRSRAAMNPP